jgi:hypothetical protein
MSTDSLRDFIANHDDRWLFVILYIGLAVVLSIALSLFWLVAVAGLHFALEYLRQGEYRTRTLDIATHALWEIKLDIALVLLALAMALYMDVVMGLLGLQSAARATAASRIGMRAARFAAWQRNLRAVVLLADDIARVIQIGITRFLRRAPATASSDGAGAMAVAAAGAGGIRRETPSPGTRDLRPGQVPETAAAAGAPEPPEPPEAPEPLEPLESRSGRPPRSWREPWTTGDRFTLGLAFGCVALMAIAPMVTDHTWHGALAALLSELQPFPAK